MDSPGIARPNCKKESIANLYTALDRRRYLLALMLNQRFLALSQPRPPYCKLGQLI